MKCILRWVNEEIKLVLVVKSEELESEGVQLYFCFGKESYFVHLLHYMLRELVNVATADGMHLQAETHFLWYKVVFWDRWAIVSMLPSLNISATHYKDIFYIISALLFQQTLFILSVHILNVFFKKFWPYLSKLLLKKQLKYLNQWRQNVSFHLWIKNYITAVAL